MNDTIQRSSNRSIRIFIVTLIVIYVSTVGMYDLFQQNHSDDNESYDNNSVRAVITTLVRSNHRSIYLTINMMHSIIKFHPQNYTYFYPFIIFHDENFTSSMRQQILSCIKKRNKKVRISFALVNFTTNVQMDVGSRGDKPIGYRLMCRFWTYDIFYHPAIIRGSYHYLMRMDDDSYFSDRINKDLFHYMNDEKLDYIYRGRYWEPTESLTHILKNFSNHTSWNFGCIYNNFFIIRLNWFYQSKVIQKFLHEVTKDNLMIRKYIGDGCVHAAMLEIDKNVKEHHVTDISYGHNYHVLLRGDSHWMFRQEPKFYEEIKNSCHQLIVLKGFRGTLTRINIA